MRRLIATLLLYAALTAGAAGFSRSPLPDSAERQLYAGGTHVLIIGLSTYRDRSWPTLQGPRDAKRLEQMFLERGVPPSAITVALPVPGGKPSLEETILRFGEQLPAAAAADARVVVYIAGHGYSADGIGYLILPDTPDPRADPVEFKLAAIPITTLLTWIGDIHANHVLLILDACFSGLALEALPREKFPHPPAAPEAHTRSLQVITAGTDRQTVADDGQFAELIVSGLVGAADLNLDGWISGTELGMYLRLRMTEVSGGRQIPSFGNVNLGPSFAAAENWFASAQLPLQAVAHPTDRRDSATAAFKDCEECPSLRVVPAPRDPTGAVGSYLAMGVHEVTFEEYDACFRDGQCTHWAWTEGGARGILPATDVSREDAENYARWLSCITNQRYRLPSDAEWLAAAQSERKRFSPSSMDTPPGANCRGCGRLTEARATLPVGSFAPSDLGLYDLVGNVWEWVADCGEGSQTTLGEKAACGQGTVRGGAFTTRRSVAVTLPAGQLRSDTRDRNIGFRVVRELEGASPGLCIPAGSH